MKLDKFDNYKLNENDEYVKSLEEILREWGVFNPELFLKWLKNEGYTIVQLDNVANENIKNFNIFNKIFEINDDEFDEGLEDSDEEKIYNFLLKMGVYNPDTFFDDLYNELSISIVKESDCTPIIDFKQNKIVENYKLFDSNKNIITEDIDMINKLRKTFKPTIKEIISKLSTIMMDASYHGLRARLYPSSVDEKEQYDHIMQYVYYNQKLMKGISKLEKKIEKLKKEHKISSEELREFSKFILSALNEIHYRYPWKFQGYLADFDQDDLDEMVKTYNEFVDNYVGKKIYQKNGN